MHVNWPGDKCILCLGSNELSKEHVIPDALGGMLTCNFLCQGCNSTIGYALEAGARNDPSVRMAVQNLEPAIPKLSKKLRENQKFFVERDGHKDRGRIRNGAFRVASKTADDGSLIQPADTAKRSIRTILQRAGLDESPIAEAERRLDEAAPNQRVSIGPGLEVTKWAQEQVHLDLSGSTLMSELVPTKIAFEFLACHLGTAIYSDVPPLKNLRRLILDGINAEGVVRVERLNASEYKPFHGICFEGNKPHAQVLIRLFGWLAFRVHFLSLSVSGDRFVYTHSLDSESEDIQILRP